jgi:hypothetical protein
VAAAGAKAKAVAAAAAKVAGQRLGSKPQPKISSGTFGASKR